MVYFSCRNKTIERTDSGGTNGTDDPYGVHIHLSAFVYNSNTQAFTTSKTYTVDPIMLFDQIEFNRRTIG